jgi:4'-phosphopantetheinyl transferase
MAIIKHWSILEGCRVVLWHITETIEELQLQLNATPSEWLEWQAIAHPQKKIEWLAGRVALQSLLREQNMSYEGLIKDDVGKPRLLHSSAHISITNTKEYVAAAWHPNTAIGIDLEQKSDKLIRVSSKYLNDDEAIYAQTDLDKLCTYWCSKEALYKLYGKKQLSFKHDIKIQDFEPSQVHLKGAIRRNEDWQEYQLFRFWIENACGIVAYQ